MALDPNDRVTRHYPWLAPVPRRPSGPVNYFYVLGEDLKKIPPGSSTTLAVYPDSQITLLRAGN